MLKKLLYVTFIKSLILAIEVALFALGVASAYEITSVRETPQAQSKHAEQFERGYDWRGPVNQY